MKNQNEKNILKSESKETSIRAFFMLNLRWEATISLVISINM